LLVNKLNSLKKGVLIVENLAGKVRELRSKSGFGMLECKKALDLFSGNINQSFEFMKMRSQAVCRRRSDGEVWNRQDYIDWILANVK